MHFNENLGYNSFIVKRIENAYNEKEWEQGLGDIYIFADIQC